MSSSLKVPVVQRADYTVLFEQYGGRTYVHCDVRRWTAAVRRALRRDFEAAAALHGGPFYACAEADHAKRDKFNRSFGFVPVGTIPHPSMRVVVYERRQEQQHGH